jgi:hypothetical protein
MQRHYGLARNWERHRLTSMPTSAFDLIVAGGILVAFFGAAIWLLVAGKRAEERDRERTAHWLRQYFYEGGLARALMARWKRQGRLTDRSERNRD